MLFPCLVQSVGANPRLPGGACLRLVSSTRHAAHRTAAKEFQDLRRGVERNSEERGFLFAG